MLVTIKNEPQITLELTLREAEILLTTSSGIVLDGERVSFNNMVLDKDCIAATEMDNFHNKLYTALYDSLEFL